MKKERGLNKKFCYAALYRIGRTVFMKNDCGSQVCDLLCEIDKQHCV